MAALKVQAGARLGRATSLFGPPGWGLAEPSCPGLSDKEVWLFQKRDESDTPTVPSSLGKELLYNPFLRVV